MSSSFRRRIGSTLVSILNFSAEEWAEIDFTETPVSGKLHQKDYEVQSEVSYDEETLTVILTTEITNFNVGTAIYKISIGNIDLPTGYNLKVELFEGV